MDPPDKSENISNCKDLDLDLDFEFDDALDPESDHGNIETNNKTDDDSLNFDSDSEVDNEGKNESESKDESEGESDGKCNNEYEERDISNEEIVNLVRKKEISTESNRYFNPYKCVNDVFGTVYDISLEKSDDHTRNNIVFQLEGPKKLEYVSEFYRGNPIFDNYNEHFTFSGVTFATVNSKIYLKVKKVLSEFIGTLKYDTSSSSK